MKSLRCMIGRHDWEPTTEKKEVEYAVYSMWTSPHPERSDWFEYEAKCSRCGEEDTLVDEVFRANHPACLRGQGYTGKTNTVRKPEE